MKRPAKEIYHKIWNKYYPDDQIKKRDGYVIHHIDGNPFNNDISNLQKMLNIDHNRMHNIGENNPFYGKQHENHPKGMLGKNHSEEAKKKISNSLKGRMLGNKHFFYGKKHTNEFKEQIGKLDIKTVEWIKNILSSNEYKVAYNKKLINQTKLGNLFGITQSVISNIKNNKSWCDL